MLVTVVKCQDSTRTILIEIMEILIFTSKGNVDIDAIGVGLQANQRGHIDIVDGGGRIITHPLENF